MAQDSLKIPIDSLPDVVVEVEKLPSSKSSIAQQIISINGQQIQQAQAATSADLLETANLFVQRSQAGGGSVVLRGFEASRVLLVIDGVRMNNLMYRTGHLQNLITIDPNSLDKVEVLLGAASTIYGSDALGGAVHLYTPKAKFSLKEDSILYQINAQSRYETASNGWLQHLNLSLGGQRWATYTSLSYNQFGDVKSGRNPNFFYAQPYGERNFYVERINGQDSLIANPQPFKQLQSGYKQYDLVQKIFFQPNPNQLHTLNFQLSNSSNIPRYDRLTDPSNNGLRFAQWYYGPQFRLLGLYKLELQNPNGWFQKNSLNLHFQQIEESRHSRRFGSNWLDNRVEKAYIGGFGWDMERSAGAHKLKIGFDGQWQRLKSAAYRENILDGSQVGLDTRYPDGWNEMGNIAAYLSYNFKINPSLQLNAGGRLGLSHLYSEFADTSFFPFPFKDIRQNYLVYAGHIGLIKQLPNNWRVAGLISSGFRAPNIDDLSKVFESATGKIIVPNPELKAEKTLSSELSINKNYRGWSWENTGYYTLFLDAIAVAAAQFAGQDSILYDGVLSQVLSSQNRQQGFLYGYHSQLNGKIGKFLALSASFNYSYGRINTENGLTPLDHIPPMMARLQFSYNDKKLQLTTFAQYQGWKRLPDYSPSGEDNLQYATPEGMPAWLSLNVRGGYQVHKLLTINAGINNILDSQYRHFASGINAPGRNFFLSLRLSLANF